MGGDQVIQLWNSPLIWGHNNNRQKEMLWHGCAWNMLWLESIFVGIGWLWICHFWFHKAMLSPRTGAKKKRKHKTFCCTLSLMQMHLKRLVRYKKKKNLNRLFNRTHPLCMAAHRLLRSLLFSSVTAKCLGVTAGTPDLSDWISAISGQCA